MKRKSACAQERKSWYSFSYELSECLLFLLRNGVVTFVCDRVLDIPQCRQILFETLLDSLKLLLKTMWRLFNLKKVDESNFVNHTSVDS